MGWSYFFLWLGFRYEWVVVRICVQLVKRDGLRTVDVVPPIASELGLVEQSTICAEERGSLLTLATVMAYVVGLATSLHVSIHARPHRNMVTGEAGVWHAVVYGEVDARSTRHVAKVLWLLVFTQWLRTDDRLLVVCFIWIVLL